MIESGVELDTGPDPALHLALKNKNEDIAIALLEAGADFELRDSVNTTQLQKYIT